VLMLRARPLLYQPSRADAAYVAGALAVLLLCAICATFLPARRAARISPSEAIRID